jgi:5'-nucleotidase
MTPGAATAGNAMPHILVTNDDGHESPGIHALRAALAEIADVSVVAPDRNRSGVARAITFREPLHVEEVVLPDGSVAHATDGTPVDCVRLAALGMLGRPPDMVVSGINIGLNLGDDVTYSGTVAAALEGVLLGVPSIAVSQQVGGAWSDDLVEAMDFTAAARFAARLVPHLLAGGAAEGLLLNVNVPLLASERPVGARITRLGRRIYNDSLLLEQTVAGRRRYTLSGDAPSHHHEEGTDFAAIDDREISVTPLHFDLTDIGAMNRLEALRIEAMLHDEARIR